MTDPYFGDTLVSYSANFADLWGKKLSRRAQRRAWTQMCPKMLPQRLIRGGLSFFGMD